MGLRIYRLPLVAGATRLSDVYGDGAGVVSAAHDIPFRQLDLLASPGPATIGDSPSLTAGSGIVLSAAGGVGASPYAAQVLADGANHYWRLGEPSGLTAADQVGGAPGTLSGGITLGQPGPLADGSTAMVFNGTTGKIALASLTFPAVPVTLEAWIKLPGPDLTVRPILANQAAAAVDQPPLLAVYNGVTILNVQNAPANVEGLVRVDNNVWHHVVGVSDGALGRLYVDGVADNAAQTLARTLANTHPGAIGGNPAVPALFWNGGLAEVASYLTALTAPQVAAHYALRTATASVGVGTPLVLGPFHTGPLKLSQLYALGTGALQITGVPF